MSWSPLTTLVIPAKAGTHFPFNMGSGLRRNDNTRGWNHNTNVIAAQAATHVNRWQMGSGFRRNDGFWRAVLGVAALLLSVTTSLGAQSAVEAQLRQHADSLARIRSERDALEAQMRAMQGRARDITEEMNNIAQQTATAARIVKALDGQLDLITAEVSNSTANLVRAQDELALKEADVRRRLIDIYRRGPLHTLEVLFSAQSFTDLIARYKYLHLQTIRDRAMVKRVNELKEDIENNRSISVRLAADVGVNRAEKLQEEERYRILEQQRRQALAQVQQSTAQTQRRLTQIAEDEKRLNGVLASLNAAAREARAAAAGGGPPPPSVFRLGAALDWPVVGELLYRFGIVTNANNTQTKQNGIGVSAPRSAEVRAVADGRVGYARDFGGFYGRTVLLVHPSGDYTVYASLDRIAADSGALVAKGQVIGTVGQSDTNYGPRLHFEVRLSSPNAEPRAVDPLPFLRTPRQ